ncbi:MAG TPA: hypothetical protein VN229_18450 [Terriglobales bacterium]|nr:hypothetical protein [Terriglobales bacterium]
MSGFGAEAAVLVDFVALVGAEGGAMSPHRKRIIAGSAAAYRKPCRKAMEADSGPPLLSRGKSNLLIGRMVSRRSAGDGRRVGLIRAVMKLIRPVIQERLGRT